MKLLVALGLVAATLALWEPSTQIYQGSERAFQKGYTYIFTYNGQVVSGVPAKGASSHAIQQATGKVYVTVGDKYWTMRGDDMKITHGQRKIEEPRLYEKLNSLEEHQLTEEQISILRLPVRFRYHQGIISDVHFTDRDNAWSENLKKSVLSMLQMQLSPKNQQEFSTLADKEIDENNKYFTQPERVLEGECEAAYTIVDGEKKDEKEVTKTLNFNKCSKRVDIRYGFRFNSECENCVEEDSRPESQVVFNYKVKGDDKSFLIKEIQVKSEYIFSPLSKKQQMLATYQHTIMRLIKIVEAERVEEPRWSTKKTTIMYNYEKELAREQFWMNGDEENWKISGFSEIFSETPKKEIVEKAVQQMIQSMDESEKEGVKLESTHQMARIVLVLRMCNREEMMEIHHFVCESTKFDKEQQKKVNEIMADALAIAGTKVTIEHLIEKIEKKQISPIKAALTLKSLVNARVSSEKIVEMLLRLSKSKVAREEPSLRQSAMLTAGALMNVMCGKNQEKWAVEIDGEKKCGREQKMSWLSTLKSLYSESSDKYEKILVLKTLANSGMDVAVHFLEDLIHSKSEEIIIRSTAIDALRMIREEMPRKVQSLLLPIFKSRHQPVSLRMSACYQILHSKPSLPVLEQIVDTLNRESNHQLRSFCYSLLRSFQDSENPCEKQLSNDVTVVLRSLRFRPSLESRHFHASTYSEPLDLGLSIDFGSVFTNESMIPRELISSFDGLFAGQWSKQLAQIGFSQQNLDSILIPLLNKLEKTETESVVRGLRSEKKFISESLKELVNQMKIAVRRSESRGEPFGMLYIRYKNLDYALLPIDESIISQYTRSQSSSLSEILRDLAKGQRFNVAVASFLYERNRMIPTSSGVPLLTTQKMPTLAVVEGHIKMELSTRPTIRLQMEPSIASTHVTEMQLLTPLQQTGARVFHSIQASFPIDSTIEYNYERQQVKATIRPPTKEKRVFIFETRPVNFVRTFSHRGSPMVQEKTITLQRLERNAIHYEHEFGERLTGIKAEVFGSVHRHMFNTEEKLEAILYGENHVQLNLIPTNKALKEIVFEMEPKWVSEKTGLQSPRYNKEFEEVDFRMEDSEEENEWEPEQKRSSRHSETKKYYEEKIEGEKKGIEGRIVFKGYTVGGPKEINARFELMGQCEEDGKYCRVEIQGKRSPLFIEENRDWELICKAELVLPESPKSLRQLREQKHREIQATVDLRWGSEEKNEIKMKIQAEQDKEMQKIVRDIKIEGQEEEKKGGLSQLEVLKEASRLNKVSVLINHDLTKKNEKVMENLYSLIKARYFIESEVEPIRRSKGSLLVKVTVDPEECRRVNVSVETSDERLSLPSILSPLRLPLPTIAKSSSSANLYNKINNVISKQATCEVRSNKITTFDDLTYKTPMTTCYQVLAKDCSQEPEYAILMKKTKKNSEEKQLKIFTSENKEIEIEIDEEKEKLVCKIDGRRVEDEQTLQEHGIELIGERSIEVVLPKIAVRFDGYMCEIKADKRTQNKQCGMCGHYDGHRDNEFRRADNEETEDIEEFQRSWLKKDSECEMEENKLKEKTNYGFEENKESTEFDSEEDDFERVKKVKKMHKKTIYRDNEEQTYEPIEKTLVVEKEFKTCFSTQPQPSCRPEDEIHESTQKKVQLACVPRGDRKVRQMMNMIKNEEIDQVSRLIEKLQVTSTEHIRVPTLCRVY